MRRLVSAGVVTALLALGAAMPGAAQDQPPSKAPSANDKLRITGWALNMSNMKTGANATIQIDIDGWSSPALRAEFIDVFMAKKQDGLVSALEKSKSIGKFRFPGYMGPDPNNVMRLGTDIKYAFNHPGEDGGRRIVIITPRVMGFAEVRNQPRTVDYPFSLFELRFNKAGEGEGRLAYATQITFDKKKQVIEIENYSSEPVRLNNLKLEVKK